MQGKRVLLVGEIGTMTGELLLKLREQGHSILIAETGKEAMETALRCLPEVALIDVQMKGRFNAASIASYFTENLNPSPAILYLAFCKDDVPSFPHAEYLMKPIAVFELADKLRTIKNNGH